MKKESQALVAIEMLMVTKTNLAERLAAVAGLRKYVESNELRDENDRLTAKMNKVSAQLARLTVHFPEIDTETQIEPQEPDFAFDLNSSSIKLELDRTMMKAA
jgi:hypothetical protein